MTDKFKDDPPPDDDIPPVENEEEFDVDDEEEADRAFIAEFAERVEAGHRKQIAAGLYDPWAEYYSPDFPLDVLPPVLRAFVEAKATETGACLSAVAMSALTVCSAALTHEAVLHMKHGKNYPVRPALWTVLVGSVSAKKTPAMTGAVYPLGKVQREQFAIHKRQTEQNPEARQPDQFLAYDITEEMLADILSHQNRGILLHRDELAGWIGGMEKYASGKAAMANRAFWLNAREGGSYNMQRLSRKTIPINNLSCSILGGIQPSRLQQVKTFTADGLLQRFIPVMMRKAQRDSDVFNTSARTEFEEFIRNLLTYEKFATELSPEARSERRKLADYLFELEGNDTEGEAFQSFVGKLSGVWGNLCLLLHIIWGHRAAEPVACITAQMASFIIAEFVLPHGLAFYRLLAGNSADNDFSEHKAIAAWLAGRPENVLAVKTRDLAMGPRCCRGLSPTDIGKKLAPFIAGGWLEPVEQVPWNGAWTINPEIRTAFVQQAETYAHNLKALQERIAGKEEEPTDD